MKLSSESVLLSVVVPVYNEEAGIAAFHKLLEPEITKAIGDKPFELIYVNDGSTDNTLDILTGLAKEEHRIKVVNLSRNFGKEIATTAGVSFATGTATVIMDGDGQHPPELLSELVKKWQNGAQVVVGVRANDSGEGFVKRYGSKLFYKAFNRATGTVMVPRSTDFRLFDANVRDEFMRFSERNRITRGLIDWLGFERDYVYFISPSRIAGTATYNTSQLIKLAANSFTSLSLKPLFFFGWTGLAIVGLSLAFGLFTLVEQFVLLDPLKLHFSGSVILGNFIAFLVGIVLISQAMLAVYISHIHTQTQGRPLFVVDKAKSTNL